MKSKNKLVSSGASESVEINNQNVSDYWKTLLMLMPETILANNNFSINFHVPTQQSPFAHITRMCVAHQKYYTVHDELFFGSSNDGGQLVFDLHLNYTFKKVPDQLNKYYERLITEVQAAAKIKGAEIIVIGYGSVAKSDGTRWVRRSIKVCSTVFDMWDKLGISEEMNAQLPNNNKAIQA